MKKLEFQEGEMNRSHEGSVFVEHRIFLRKFVCNATGKYDYDPATGSYISLTKNLPVFDPMSL